MPSKILEGAREAAELAQHGWLIEFLAESNRIEGILSVRSDEVHAALEFLAKEKITVEDLQAYVSVTQPGALLRDRVGMNVRVGRYYPPGGGRNIIIELEKILRCARRDPWGPFKIHTRYEKLHPFTDGNGRSGRLLWLWMMRRLGIPMAPMGFLQTWYYQALEASDG